jgi:transposase
MKSELSKASEKESQLLLQGLEADYESKMDDLRQLLAEEHAVRYKKSPRFFLISAC